jgi:outer membrane protein OmpA-like peptidoglycan-associated protein
MRKILKSAALGAALVGTIAAGTLTGCTGSAKKGAVVGGAVGAATGAIIGHQSGRTGTGAAAGAVVGAAAGAVIGDYMARQKQELEQVPGAEVVQEGDELRVKFQDAILFDIDSSEIKPTAKENLQKMAAVLVKYPDTDLVVAGHTDNTGSDAHNQKLSERRAYAVKDYLVTYGVAPARLQARGFGEARPVADNDTVAGRTQNRRVEVEIAANEALRARAAAQEGGAR